MSSFNEVLENWHRAIEPLQSESNSANRIDAIIFLLSTLRDEGFTISQVTEKEILLILNKLDKQFINKTLRTLYEQFVIMDVCSMRDAILPTTPTPKQVVVQQAPVTEMDEDDVLAKEGFMEPPELEPRVIDEEFDKLIGYADYE